MRWEQKDRNETKYELAIDTVVNPIPIDENYEPCMDHI